MRQHIKVRLLIATVVLLLIAIVPAQGQDVVIPVIDQTNYAAVEPLATYDFERVNTLRMSFSPDSRYAFIRIYDRDDPVVIVWDMVERREVAQHIIDGAAYFDLSPDGDLIAIGSITSTTAAHIRL